MGVCVCSSRRRERGESEYIIGLLTGIVGEIQFWMGHKGGKCQFNTNEYADFIKVKTTTTAAAAALFTFHRVEHYLLCYSFPQEIAAHIAFATERAVIIPFGNINKKNREKIKLFWVCVWNRSTQTGKKDRMTRWISGNVRRMEESEREREKLLTQWLQQTCSTSFPVKWCTHSNI